MTDVEESSPKVAEEEVVEDEDGDSKPERKQIQCPVEVLYCGGKLGYSHNKIKVG